MFWGHVFVDVAVAPKRVERGLASWSRDTANGSLLLVRATFVWPWKKCSQFISRKQCLARLKQSFSLFAPRKLLIWVVNSSIAQSHYCIPNDVKAKYRSLSWKFHGEMTLFASAFAKPMKNRARLFLFHKPIKCFAFCLSSVFTFIFQGHMKVAL